MKKLILLLLLMPIMASSQVFNVVEKGYYFVFVNDTIVSQHSKPHKAVAMLKEYQLKYPDYPCYVKQPNIEVEIDRKYLLEILNAESLPDTLDLGTTLPEPLPNNPVMVSVDLQNGTYFLTFRMSEGSVMPTGGFDVFVDGEDRNNHTDGIDMGLTMEISDIADTTIQHCFFVEARYVGTVDPDNFPRSNEICYPPDTSQNIEVIDQVVLEDFGDFEVVVTTPNMEVLDDCKQKEIVDIENIEQKGAFFVKYKSKALGGMVSKMVVENGELKYFNQN